MSEQEQADELCDRLGTLDGHSHADVTLPHHTQRERYGRRNTRRVSGGQSVDMMIASNSEGLPVKTNTVGLTVGLFDFVWVNSRAECSDRSENPRF